MCSEISSFKSCGFNKKSFTMCEQRIWIYSSHLNWICQKELWVSSSWIVLEWSRSSMIHGTCAEERSSWLALVFNCNWFFDWRIYRNPGISTRKRIGRVVQIKWEFLRSLYMPTVVQDLELLAAQPLSVALGWRSPLRRSSVACGRCLRRRSPLRWSPIAHHGHHKLKLWHFLRFVKLSAPLSNTSGRSVSLHELEQTV